MMLPDDHRPHPHLSTGFYEGTLPSWLTDQSSGGGSINVSDASVEGGRARLSTGVTAAGDKGEIRSAVNFQPEAHDVIRIKAMVQSSSSDNALVNVRFGFVESGNNYIQLRMEQDDIRTVVGGTAFTTAITPVTPEVGQTEYELRWYTARDVIEVLQEGAVAGQITDANAVPDPSLAYDARVWINTSDTTADRILDVYTCQIGYMDDAQTR